MMLIDGNLNDDISVQRGNLLISEPFLPDANFERTVILLCEHNSEGSFGLVLNKTTGLKVSEASEHIRLDNRLYVGGPVQQNTLHFIHTFAMLPEAVLLKDGIYWGGDFEGLCELGEQGKLHEGNSRFFIGYSGWGAGQLEQELLQNSWIISRGFIGTIFNAEPSYLWRSILKEMGGRYKVFANFPEDPRLN